jgi:hypothetical protein
VKQSRNMTKGKVQGGKEYDQGKRREEGEEERGRRKGRTDL